MEKAISPSDAPLPITETGYRSHFIAATAIAAAGGPVAYVDRGAASKATLRRGANASNRQFALF